MGLTIYDISEKAGVSIATVSRVFNGSNNVSEKTKQKVLDVIDAYGYTPNAFARGLGLNSMKTIGILCADSSDLFLAKAVYYLEQFLRKNDYDTILCCTGYEIERKQDCMDLLLSKHVDGIVLAGSNFLEHSENGNSYINTAAAQVPVMLLNADYDYDHVYSSLCDDTRSMMNATEAMIQSGHKELLYLYNSNSYSGLKKKEGFTAALEANGLPIRNKYLSFYNGPRDDIEKMTEHITKLADNGMNFDGIIASEDILALAAIKYARRNNRSIPDDLSIIGYNNSLLCNCCEPELTSVDNRLETICKTLVSTLVDVLSGQEVPKKSIFYGDIKERATTAFHHE